MTESTNPAGSSVSTPSTMEEIATALYPNAPTAEEAQAASPRSGHPTAAQIQAYGNGNAIPKVSTPSAEIAALRQASGFASVNLEGSFRVQTQDITSMFEAADLSASPDVVAAQVLEFKAMAHDLEANHDDVSLIATMAKAAIVNPPTPEQLASDERASVNGLRTTYGRDWHRVLQDTQKLVARDPRLLHMLGKTGLGSNPRIVARLAELSQQARSRGRIK